MNSASSDTALSRCQECGAPLHTETTALKNFLSHEWERARAQKRGGGAAVISMDEALANARYERLLTAESTPEQLYDQQWAVAILDQAADRLRKSYVVEKRSDLFDQRQPFLSANSAGQSYALVAARLGLSESAVKSAIYRLRQRYQQLIREEVAQTVSSPADLDDELRHLIAVIRS